MAKVGEGFVLEAVHGRSFKGGDRLVEYGTDAFVTSGTTKEVTTLLSVCECALLTIDDVSPVANDLLGTDRVITTGAITVARPAGTTSGLSFSYMFLGYRYD
jgi:hypothetical protein